MDSHKARCLKNQLGRLLLRLRFIWLKHNTPGLVLHFVNEAADPVLDFI